MKINTRLKLLFVLILTGVLLVLPLVYAQNIQNLGTFQQGSCIELKQTCGNCTFVNITSVLYPNSSEAVTNVAMTRDGTDYNYTFCLTQTAGTYIYNTLGDDDGLNTVAPVSFEVSYQGYDLTTSQALLYISLFGISIGLFLLSLYGAIKIRWGNRVSEEGKIVDINDLKYIKIALWVSAYLLLLWIAFLSQGVARNFLALDGLTTMFYFIYWFLLIGVAPVFIVSLLTFVVRFVNDRKIQKALQRGLPFR